MVKVYKNWREAHKANSLPGSYQDGSYGPKGKGIVRSYSNGTPGKDFIKAKPDGKGYEILYRLKNEAYGEKFSINIRQKQSVRFFRKVSDGVEDLGSLRVVGFTDSHGKTVSRDTTHVKMVSENNIVEKEENVNKL